ncbi:hypothetical protein ARMSODRAFT_980934 [Armillaria solidipes]|uniref:Uncharacterized protein n=1 Tax=Armillaria solidipes TaxID=1076256 RepID=A0A2H3ATS4_9AGAR|nr:hypothetical protein ARMSODRAFT_980934 [Armillaria solidipes]
MSKERRRGGAAHWRHLRETEFSSNSVVISWTGCQLYTLMARSYDRQASSCSSTPSGAEHVRVHIRGPGTGTAVEGIMLASPVVDAGAGAVTSGNDACSIQIKWVVAAVQQNSQRPIAEPPKSEVAVKSSSPFLEPVGNRRFPQGPEQVIYQTLTVELGD